MTHNDLRKPATNWGLVLSAVAVMVALTAQSVGFIWFLGDQDGRITANETAMENADEDFRDYRVVTNGEARSLGIRMGAVEVEISGIQATRGSISRQLNRIEQYVAPPRAGTGR